MDSLINVTKSATSFVGETTKSATSFVGETTKSATSFVGDTASGVAGGLGSSFTTLKVLKADTKARLMGLSPWKVVKVGRIIDNMQSSDYQFTDEEVDLMVRALYVTQTDEDFKAAFDMLDSRLNQGIAAACLKGEDFRNVLPLVGESVEEDKIDALFKEVDADGSGNIEFDEFCALMLGMNPKEGDSNPLLSFTSSMQGAATSGFSSLSSGLGDNFTTLTVLKPTTNARLTTSVSPLGFAKIGRIIKAMQTSSYGFSNNEIDDVILALYGTKADADYQKVFQMFDAKLAENGTPNGHLTVDATKALLPLLGEDVSEEKLDEAFNQIDSDGSGTIEFDEFKALCQTLTDEGKSTFGF